MILKTWQAMASGRVLFVLLCGLVLAGCNSSTTVSGKVTLDGVPLPTGEVMFHPESDGAMAIGSIENGKYQMYTGQSEKIEPGPYHVTITATAPLDPAALESSPDPNGMEAIPKRITPDIYASAETSPFKAEVKKGSNTFDFDLKSK